MDFYHPWRVRVTGRQQSSWGLNYIILTRQARFLRQMSYHTPLTCSAGNELCSRRGTSVSAWQGVGHRHTFSGAKATADGIRGIVSWCGGRTRHCTCIIIQQEESSLPLLSEDE